MVVMMMDMTVGLLSESPSNVNMTDVAVMNGVVVSTSSG